MLRTVIRLELANVAELADATLLPVPDVQDAVRFAVARGYLERYEGGVRVAWPWYRTITTVLNRKHLLPSL